MTLVGLAHAVVARALSALFLDYQLQIIHLPAGSPIPGSYWGEPEAGLLGNRLYVCPETPLNSALHEACHFLCMDATRRERLDRDAGGDDLEECAVCYLSVLLAERLPGFGREAMFADMDAWGYSFRLGTAAAWFREDAQDAVSWLTAAGWLDRSGCLTAEQGGHKLLGVENLQVVELLTDTNEA